LQRPASQACRDLWDVFTPEAMGRYGLGVANLLPVRDGQGAGRYLARYVGRQLGTRQKGDRGARLVRYSQSWQRAVMGPFSWCDGRAQRAKERAKQLATSLWKSPLAMAMDCGRNWRWKLMRTLYCSQLVYDALIVEAERELEFYGGPLFALDEIWAKFDRSAAEGAKEDQAWKLLGW